MHVYKCIFKHIFILIYLFDYLSLCPQTQTLNVHSENSEMPRGFWIQNFKCAIYFRQMKGNRGSWGRGLDEQEGTPQRGGSRRDRRYTAGAEAKSALLIFSGTIHLRGDSFGRKSNGGFRGCWDLQSCLLPLDGAIHHALREVNPSSVCKCFQILANLYAPRFIIEYQQQRGPAVICSCLMFAWTSTHESPQHAK